MASEPTTIHILAGTHDQAQACARAHGLRGGAWRYIPTVSSLLGLMAPTVWLYGRFYERTDWREMQAMLEDRRIQAIHIAALPEVWGNG